MQCTQFACPLPTHVTKGNVYYNYIHGQFSFSARKQPKLTQALKTRIVYNYLNQVLTYYEHLPHWLTPSAGMQTIVRHHVHQATARRLCLSSIANHEAAAQLDKVQEGRQEQSRRVMVNTEQVSEEQIRTTSSRQRASNSFMRRNFPCTSVSRRPCLLQCAVLRAKSTFTVATEKCRQLTVHRLRIIKQITACPTYATMNGQLPALLHSDSESAFRPLSLLYMAAVKRTCTENDVTC